MAGRVAWRPPRRVAVAGPHPGGHAGAVLGVFRPGGAGPGRRQRDGAGAVLRRVRRRLVLLRRAGPGVGNPSLHLAGARVLRRATTADDGRRLARPTLLHRPSLASDRLATSGRRSRAPGPAGGG